MKLGMVGDIRDKLKFRHHGSHIEIIYKAFHLKQYILIEPGYGEHGVLGLKLWLCSGI